jgi:hypothetical protein
MDTHSHVGQEVSMDCEHIVLWNARGLNSLARHNVVTNMVVVVSKGSQSYVSRKPN